MSESNNLSLQEPSKINQSYIFDNEPPNSTITNIGDLLLSHIHLSCYQLSSEQIDWINIFIKSSPASFLKVTTDIQSITSTGEIGLNKIPQIVKLLADIYYSGAFNYNLVNPDYIITLIKFTIDVLLNSKILILPDTQKELIKELVDSSLTLLSMNISTIETKIQVIKSSNCFIRLLQFLKLK